MSDTLNRREFVKASAAGVSALAALSLSGVNPAFASSGRGSGAIRIGVIGCGGRGTGAAMNALEASPDARVVALADLFPDRVNAARGYLASSDNPWRDRVDITDDRVHTGFDNYKRLLAHDVDMVILATAPHFRSIHLAAAVEKGCHVFIEKPVAVDGPGIRSVLESAAKADAKGLSIVAGTQRRHETSYREAMARIKDGALGRIVATEAYWNQGGLWMHPRRPEWSDMEWQIRNWLYFTWLSGDHIVEQHVHNLDVINWAMSVTSGESHPASAQAVGGRQVRTDPAYGHIFDHFGVVYEYASGAACFSMCRQIDGTSSRVDEVIRGTNGTCVLRPGFADFRPVPGQQGGWKFTSQNNNPYVQEHVDLFAAITSGTPVNEARQVAESTLTAIMGRMAAYTGRTVTWDQALASAESLAPASYDLGPLPTPEVPMPGKTPLA